MTADSGDAGGSRRNRGAQMEFCFRLPGIAMHYGTPPCSLCQIVSSATPMAFSRRGDGGGCSLYVQCVWGERNLRLRVNRANSGGRWSLLLSVLPLRPPTTISLPPLKSAFLAEVNRTISLESCGRAVAGRLLAGGSCSVPGGRPWRRDAGAAFGLALQLVAVRRRRTRRARGSRLHHPVTLPERLCRGVTSARTRSLTPS